jgi:predicted phage-related endonuclease
VHTEYPFLTANPDRISLDHERLVEIKTTGMGGIKYWRDPDNTSVIRPPDHVILQVNWYLGFLGWDQADIVLLCFAESLSNGERYLEFPRAFDADMFEQQVQLAVNFWQNHVLAEVPPEPSDPDDHSTFLNLVHRHRTDDMIVATPEIDKIAAELNRAIDEADRAKNRETELRNQLKAFVGGKAGISSEDFIFTWKTTKSGGTDWKSLAMSYHSDERTLQRFAKPGFRRTYFKYRGTQEAGA